jgi:hypothetical protein
LTRPVIFLPAARLEVTGAQDWCEAETRGLGAGFRAEVDRQVERIATHPLHFPTVHGDVRLSACSATLSARMLVWKAMPPQIFPTPPGGLLGKIRN